MGLLIWYSIGLVSVLIMIRVIEGEYKVRDIWYTMGWALCGPIATLVFLIYLITLVFEFLNKKIANYKDKKLF